MGKRHYARQSLHFITKITAGLSIVLGLVVLVGWYTNNETLIQIFPVFVPMQFNTALGFLICGIGLLSHSFGFNRLVTICGLTAFFTGFLTLLQYVLNINLGIDQLLMDHYIMIETSHPGRMAPNTALCFGITGAVLLILSRVKRTRLALLVTGILGSIIMALGVVSFFGYLTSVETAYGWGNLTRMAVHTAVGFFVLGTGIFAVAWSEGIGEDTWLPDWIAAPAGIGMVTVVLAEWQALNTKISAEHLSFPVFILITGLLATVLFVSTIRFAQILWLRAKDVERVNRQLENEISEHQQAREAFSTHLQNTPIGALSWDLNFKAIEWNPAAEAIFGYTKAEALGKHATELILPEDMKELVDDLFRTLISQKGGDHSTNENITKDGRRIICDWYNTTLKDVAGNVIGVGSLFQDVTDRVISEKRLQESEERFRILFENAPLGYQSLDANGNLIELNETWCELLGYTKEEVLGKNFSEFIHPDFKEIFKENFPKFKSMGYILGIEFEMIKKDGTEIIVAFDGKIGHEDDGSFKQTHCVLSDVSERRRTVDALQESEEKYRSMMESMKNASYICSPELCIEYMNPAMIDRIGKDATGERCYKAIYGRREKCPWCVFDQIQKGEHVDYEVVDPKNNRFYSVTNSPISHSNGAVSKLTIFHDITEIKKIEAELQQSRKMESIGTLAGGIAHDFNNLLYMISGNAELALEDIPKWNPVHTNLEEIKFASLRAAGIVKQLLNFSRKTDQKLKSIGAVTVIKDGLKFLRSTIPTTIDIRKHLPDSDITILADPVQINQVLMNLCINASQAMEETGGILEVNVETTTLEAGEIKNSIDLSPGKHLKMTVSDTGPGIDSEIISRIFDPYFTTKEMGKGSGMGLSIVHGIIKNHHGAISVDSKLGKGTTFTILFPVVDEKPDHESETTDKIPRGCESILFVDDEKSITNMIQKMLKRLGYKVEISLNPLQALDLFQSKPDSFDLVITDMTMPQMTGAKLSKKLIEIRSDIPVIICTGHSSLIDEEKAKQFGIADYVMKPVSMSTIAKAIRKVLDK